MVAGNGTPGTGPALGAHGVNAAGLNQLGTASWANATLSNTAAAASVSVSEAAGMPSVTDASASVFSEVAGYPASSAIHHGAAPVDPVALDGVFVDPVGVTGL